MRQGHLGSHNDIVRAGLVPPLEGRIGPGGPFYDDISPVAVNVEINAQPGYYRQNVVLGLDLGKFLPGSQDPFFEVGDAVLELFPEEP